MPSAETAARPDTREEAPVNANRASASNAGSFMQSLFGTLVAVAVAALALWPHVRTLFD